MDAFALLAAESPDDEDHCIPHAVHAISPPAAYRVQFTATSMDRGSAPRSLQKTPF